MSSVSAHTLSEAQRKEVLDRLILERQSRPSLSSAPSTESIADKRERVQQLLRERRASQGMSLTFNDVSPCHYRPLQAVYGACNL